MKSPPSTILKEIFLLFWTKLFMKDFCMIDLIL